MGVYDDACDLIQRGTADFGAVLRHLEKTAITRQMTPIGHDVDNLVHRLPQYDKRIANILIILQELGIS